MRLPASRDEVLAVAGGPEDRRLLADAATEPGFAAALATVDAGRPWRSVHLACHGLVDVERPEFSCLALTPGGGEDGLLTAHEVLRLPLHADLAVLSACQTGRGRLVRAEGVLGLTRAFMFAGAPRVLVSLWNVDDAATAFLMQVFYREWRAGRETAEALRLAQIAVRDHEVRESVADASGAPQVRVRRPWSDPHHWGAWTLWGLPD